MATSQDFQEIRNRLGEAIATVYLLSEELNEVVHAFAYVGRSTRRADNLLAAVDKLAFRINDLDDAVAPWVERAAEKEADE